MEHAFQLPAEYLSPQSEGFGSAQKYLLSDRRLSRREPMKIEIETLMPETGRIEITSRRLPSDVLVSNVEAFLARMRELRAMPENWDSYGAPRVNPVVLSPTLRIALKAIGRCLQPRLEANAEGGLDLVWEREAKGLTLSILEKDVGEIIYSDADDFEDADTNLSDGVFEQFVERYSADM